MAAGKGGNKATELMRHLLGLQRELPFPVLLCPVHVVWSRAPLDTHQDIPQCDAEATPSAHLAGGHATQAAHTSAHKGHATHDAQTAAAKRACNKERPKQSYNEWIFGSRRRPGLLRTFVSMLCDRRDFVQIGGGAPINLSEWLLEYRAAAVASAHQPDTALTHRLLQLLHHRFAAQWLQVTGPPHLSKAALVSRVLRSRRVRAAIASAVSSSGSSEAVYEKLASKATLRAAADLRFWLLRIVHVVMQWMLSMFLHAIYFDETGLRAVQRAAFERGCPILYVPAFKGRLHSVMLSLLCFARDLAVPALAGAQKLGGLLTGVSGRVFSWGGGRVMSAEEALISREVTREYLMVILEHGYNIEFAVEEDLSAPGTLSPPRLSLLNIFVDAVMSGRVKDLVIAPVSIQYDR
jgi:glycerol-3-phosphate O-acyltransferase